MKQLNDFFTWGISSGFFVALVWFLWGYVRPLMEAKKQHAKTAQERELFGLVESLADTAVTSLVSRTDITGSDKFKAATRQVQGALTAKNLHASDETIHAAVQSAYEKSDLTPTVDPSDKPQQGVVVSHE